MSAESERDVRVFRSSILKHALMLAASLGFVAIGIWIMPPDDWTRWLVIGFFGLAAMIFAVNLLPAASSLKLTRDGFEVTTLFRTSRTRWQDVSSFTTGWIATRKVVMYDPAPDVLSQGARNLAAVNRELVGAAGALPDTYGLKAEALADLMNEWRDRYLDGG